MEVTAPHLDSVILAFHFEICRAMYSCKDVAIRDEGTPALVLPTSRLMEPHRTHPWPGTRSLSDLSTYDEMHGVCQLLQLQVDSTIERVDCVW